MGGPPRSPCYLAASRPRCPERSAEMKARPASLSLLAAVLAGVPASAATFYVATNGNDAYPGSVDLPFRTVGKGVGALRAAGDTLYIRAGTYASAIYPVVSGTAAGIMPAAHAASIRPIEALRTE